MSTTNQNTNQNTNVNPIISPATSISASTSAPSNISATSSTNIISDLQTAFEEFITKNTTLFSTAPPAISQMPAESIKKIVPPTPDIVDVVSTTTNGNLDKLEIIYNGFVFKNIKIRSIEFDCADGNRYSFDSSGSILKDSLGSILTSQPTNTSSIDINEIKKGAEYLASLNLSFYTDPYLKHTIS